MTQPLFITRDQALRDELLRLAAAAGATPDLAQDGPSAMASWSAAPLIFVGLDVVEPMARCRPPRRDGVHVATLGPVPDQLLEPALAVHAESVTRFPESATWLVEQLTDLGDERPRRGVTVGVLGGSGGSGATVYAAALGQVSAGRKPAGGPAGGDTLLLDLDPLGAGLDRVLGRERLPGARWEDLGQTSGRISAQSLKEGLPRRHGLGVLTWRSPAHGLPPTFTVREVLSAARRGHDLVVVDLPRTGGDLWSEVLGRCDRVHVVVTPTVSGLAAATRLLARLPDRGRVALVLRGSGIPAADVSRALHAPVVAETGDQRSVGESIELGLGPVRSHRSKLARGARLGLAALPDAA